MIDLNKVLQEFTCDDCNMIFPGYKQFIWHRKYHSRFLPIINGSLLEQSCSLCFIKYSKKYKGESLEKLVKALEGTLQKTKSKQVILCKYYPKCIVKFSRVFEFIKHAKDVHNDDKPYACPQCNFTASRYYALRQHLYTHWRYKKTKCRFKRFNCTLCPNKYTTKERFRDHLLKHKEGDKKSLGCSFCGQKYAGADDLIKHLRIHYPTSGTYKCHLCSKELNSKRNLDAHLKGHYKVYKCQICPKEYATRSGLRSHLLLNHKEVKIKSHDCMYCGKQFLRPIELKTHLSRHHPTSEASKNCTSCDRTFSTISGLKTHLRSHLTSLDPPITPPTSSDFQCYLCSKGVSSKRKLKTHMATHEELKIFVCGVCSKGFAAKGSLTKHHRTKHQFVHLERELYECSDCGNQFGWLKSLQKHRDPDKESKETLYCKKCPKTFKNLNCFMYHNRSHREFLCEVCKKKYFTPEGYKRHLETHVTKLDPDSYMEKSSGYERPFKCTLCPKKFRRKLTLQYHLQKHEGKEPYVCEHCEKRFMKQKFLTMHLNPEKETKHLLCCKQCSETFNNINCFQHHKLSHKGGMICKVCKVKCYTREGIRNHLARHGISSGPTKSEN